jgi:NAD(P)-dependent dehydrogenase (short-subunit alcohol dehydrogenase family)
MGRLENKVAVVTGGASGMGKATARQMVAEGARVVIGDLNLAGAETLAAELGEATLAVEFDAGDPASIAALMSAAVERFGRIDILDNNAALLSPEVMHNDTNAIDTDLDLWDRVMAVNVRGYFAAAKYALPHMIAGGGGSIVNIASIAALAGQSDQIAYSTSKAAVLGLTRSIATQHGKHNIRCNAICPGLILSETALLPENRAYIDIVSRHELVTRPGRPEDIASLVCYLASDESGFITGQVITSDGGRHAHVPNLADMEDYRARQATAANH